MRLIDADALNLDYEVEMADDWKTAHEIANCVKYAPTIEAVPLGPICQWLARYATPPKYALEEVVPKIFSEVSVFSYGTFYTQNEQARAWEYHFRELLKSGLMDTEESNAESK